MNKNELLNRIRGFSGPSLLVLLSFCITTFFTYSPLAVWENNTLSWKYLLRGKQKGDPRIVLVELDNRTLSAYGFPFTRDQWAVTIKALMDWGAELIGFDMMFLDHSSLNPTGDLLLASVSSEYKSIIHASAFLGKIDEIPSQGKYPPWLVLNWDKVFHAAKSMHPFEELNQVCTNTVHLNISISNDGVCSGIPALIEHEGIIYPALGIELYRLSKKVNEKAKIVNGRLLLGEKEFSLDDLGNLLLNYRGHTDAFAHISLIDLLQSYSSYLHGKEGIYTINDFYGKIVIIGQTALGTGDYGVSPFNSTFPYLESHAILVDNLLNDRIIVKIDFWLNFLIALTFSLVCFIAWKHLGWMLSTVICIFAIIFIEAGSFWFFVKGNVWLSSTSPLFACITGYIIGGIGFSRKIVQQKNLIHNTFKRYLAPEVIDHILNNRLEIKGQRKELSILFSDIISFSSIADKGDPEEVINQLEEYFTAMSETVFSEGGTLDKFIGDGMLVFFGDPISYEDHAYRAVKTAWLMQERLKELRRDWERCGRGPFHMRIGINTGFVTVGNLGSDKYTEYTVLGKNVNLAQRIEQACEKDSILVSEKTFRFTKGNFVFESMTTEHIKGFKDEVNVYKVVALKTEQTFSQ